MARLARATKTTFLIAGVPLRWQSAAEAAAAAARSKNSSSSSTHNRYKNINSGSRQVSAECARQAITNIIW